jgi:Coenzyme PQQ synthesis protein D (PqqD)
MTKEALLQSAKLFQLGEGYMLYQPDTGRLVALNNTGKQVWELLSAGYQQDEIATLFAEHFNHPIEQTAKDVQAVLAGLNEAERADELTEPLKQASDCLILPMAIKASDGVNRFGTYRFGQHRIQLHLHDTLADIGSTYFLRYHHRAINDVTEVDILELSTHLDGFCLTFRDEMLAFVGSLAELFGRVNKLLLAWEHPDIDFLAYFHAATVSRGEHCLLLPGVSGAGKSTLTAYLVAHGFAYLGDDFVAMAASDGSFRSSPARLSLKSGSWAILEALYPELPQLPTVHCYGRTMRYVEPTQIKSVSCAQSLIVFPTYEQGSATRLNPLTPFQTLIRLLETSTTLDQPATEAKLKAFIDFVEHTPAYDLRYADLPHAKAVIEELLNHED